MLSRSPCLRSRQFRSANTNIRTLVAWCALAIVVPGADEVALAKSSTPGISVDSVAVTVGDMDRSVEFYSRVLGFRQVAEREVTGTDYEHLFGVFGLRLRAERMRLGDEYIELFQFLTPRGRPIPIDSRSNDRWFQHIAIVVSDMNAAYERLRSFHVEYASSAPQRLPDSNPNAGGIEAFYFRDPDGHTLEVLHFPAGKGQSKWQARGSLFLGIDHTAIVVTDTEASLQLYRDLLGMRISGVSENYGTEQEHLNNVFGAHLRITSLRAEQGPGVEFLEYLAPSGGRPAPLDSQANDLWYWQINFGTSNPAVFEDSLRKSHTPLISGKTTELHDSRLGWISGFVARDPDGHSMLIAAHPSGGSDDGGR
jgi:catechol 2,3-dioxygenase-like lactoylglutathione lyase family enzyme